MKDERIVYGAMCMWWDSIEKAAQLKNGLPCCPHCRGVLYEVASEEVWMDGVKKHAISKPGYVEFIQWMRGRCFASPQAAIAQYEEETSGGHC